MIAKIRSEYPCTIRKIENTWIKMHDGVRLAASIWLPDNAELKPVPAILEYLPYRKDDSRAIRDSTYLPYFAGYGFAAVRVDIRGSGSSEGILLDEYLLQEQEDALDILAWIEKQPWCTGDAGIFGISWGGFNGLQIAAHRPPQLKAIISVASTDDRYADDVHYRGGCLLASEQLPWASRMFGLNALPPDPLIVGENWRKIWLDRLENTPPYIEAWMEHQTRDKFWKHASVCENFADIECAVYAVGGWGDGYTNAIPRLLEGLPGPKKGLIGPWSHGYPHAAIPGPQIGFLQECIRWWNYWLKSEENGIMDEPMLRAWIQDSVVPASYYDERPGNWVAEKQLPSLNVHSQKYHFGDGILEENTGVDEILEIKGSQFTGSAAGLWCPYGQDVDFPIDQRSEDGLSLSFTSATLVEGQVVLGSPQVTLALASDRTNALVVVRLCDVSPSGSSLLISRGFLNLTHRDSHEDPTPLQPGKFYKVNLTMDVIGHRLPAGHRWRLTVSPTYWPMTWPSPQVVKLQIHAGEKSFVVLPVRQYQESDTNLPGFEPSEESQPIPYKKVIPGRKVRIVTHDIGQKKQEICDISDHGQTHLLEHDLVMYDKSVERYTIYEDDPLSANIESEQELGLRCGKWDIRVETYSGMSADAEQFFITNKLDAYEGKIRVFSKSWNTTVPRHLV
jgi:predicted acyl esterase